MSQEHVLDDTLEAYAMGRLAELEMDSVDEHLLICERCRRRLTETDQHIRATRIAAARIRKQEALFRRRQRPWWEGITGPIAVRPVWLLGGVTLIVSLTLLPLLRRHAQTPASPVELELRALRGGEAPGPAAARRAGAPLRLRLDLTGLPDPGPYEAVIVDASGRQIHRGGVTGPAPGDQISVLSLAAAPPPGRYWVRLYRPGSDPDSPLREYPLLLAPETPSGRQ